MLFVDVGRALGTSSVRHQTPVSLSLLTAVRHAIKRPRVVASFTTFPMGHRMAGVAGMLRSLAAQSWPLDAVIMNLPDKIARFGDDVLPIPPEIDQWKQEYPWLRVNQVKDRGPATKLLGTLLLETDPDTIIVVVDDDTFYHQDMVVALVSAMLSSTTDIIPCFHCENVRRSSFGRLRWGYAQKEGKCNGFAEGFAAYAVRPKYFDHRVQEVEQAPKGCRLHDDVFLSGSALIGSGARPYLLRPGFDSINGTAVIELGARQEESVYVANKKAIAHGEDPQRDCVAHFPFADVPI